MAAAKKSVISHYFQLNFRTVQGRVTLLLLAITLMTALAFTISYQQLSANANRQAYMRQVLAPSVNLITYLDMTMARQEPIAADDSVLAKLNVLANKWKGERAVVFYSQFLDQLNQEEASVASRRLALSRTRAELNRQLTEGETYLSRFIGNFGMFLGLWFLFMLAVGFLLCRAVMKSLFKTIRNIKKNLTDIGLGHLPEDLEVSRDEFKTVTTSMRTLVSNLNELTHFSHEVGKGNFDSNLQAFDKESTLGHSLAEMRDSLRRVADEEKNRRWYNEGIAKFSEILRRHSGNVNELCEATIGELVNYVGAIQGAIFVTQTDGSTTTLRMSGCYAYDRHKYLEKEVPADSGLLGQAFLEKAPRYLREIPRDYHTITTGLGQGLPESILIVPLKHGDDVEGVLELAGMQPFSENQLDFLNKVTESLGVSIAAVRVSEHTRTLLEESQGVAEQLQAQEEEMRQNMEEMQATQEEMQRTQRELAEKEAKLYSIINNTADSITLITPDYKVALLNDVVKKRYKGTQYESFTEGSDVLEMLGSVAQEWKAYYDRALAGETLDFTLKSSVKGEDAWRRYMIYPIRNQEDKIIGISSISRDVTAGQQLELQMSVKNAVFNTILHQEDDAYLAVDDKLRVVIKNAKVNEFIPELSNLQELNELLPALPPQEQARWQKPIQEALSGTASTLTLDHPTAGNLHLQFSPARENEQVLGVVIVVSKV